MKTYAYYVKLREAVQNNPNADLVKIIRHQSNVSNCTAWGCWAMSCMCCACCSKPGQTCIQMTDLGTNWKKILTAYQDMSAEQIRNLYMKGMSLMDVIYNHLKNDLSERKRVIKNDIAQGNVNNYNIHSLSRILLQQSLENGEWMYELVDKIKSNLFSKSIPENIDYYGLVLTQTHIRLLLACCGFFYPAICHRHMYSVNPAEITMIRKCALEQ